MAKKKNMFLDGVTVGENPSPDIVGSNDEFRARMPRIRYIEGKGKYKPSIHELKQMSGEQPSPDIIGSNDEFRARMPRIIYLEGKGKYKPSIHELKQMSGEQPSPDIIGSNDEFRAKMPRKAKGAKVAKGAKGTKLSSIDRLKEKLGERPSPDIVGSSSDARPSTPLDDERSKLMEELRAVPVSKDDGPSLSSERSKLMEELRAIPVSKDDKPSPSMAQSKEEDSSGGIGEFFNSDVGKAAIVGGVPLLIGALFGKPGIGAKVGSKALDSHLNDQWERQRLAQKRQDRMRERGEDRRWQLEDRDANNRSLAERDLRKRKWNLKDIQDKRDYEDEIMKREQAFESENLAKKIKSAEKIAKNKGLTAIDKAILTIAGRRDVEGMKQSGKTLRQGKEHNQELLMSNIDNLNKRGLAILTNELDISKADKEHLNSMELEDQKNQIKLLLQERDIGYKTKRDDKKIAYDTEQGDLNRQTKKDLLEYQLGQKAEQNRLQREHDTEQGDLNRQTKKDMLEYQLGQKAEQNRLQREYDTEQNLLKMEYEANQNKLDRANKLDVVDMKEGAKTVEVYDPRTGTFLHTRKRDAIGKQSKPSLEASLDDYRSRKDIDLEGKKELSKFSTDNKINKVFDPKTGEYVYSRADDSIGEQARPSLEKEMEIYKQKQKLNSKVKQGLIEYRMKLSGEIGDSYKGMPITKQLKKDTKGVVQRFDKMTLKKRNALVQGELVKRLISEGINKGNITAFNTAIKEFASIAEGGGKLTDFDVVFPTKRMSIMQSLATKIYNESTGKADPKIGREIIDSVDIIEDKVREIFKRTGRDIIKGSVGDGDLSERKKEYMMRALAIPERKQPNKGTERRVKVIAPNGKKGTVPYSKLKFALDRKFKLDESEGAE